MSFLAIPDFEVIQQGFADIGKKRAKNTFLLYKRKVSLAFAKLTFFAEREGFEPPVPLGTVVFKTTVIDHSTISPVL